jgi:hypothetical protein
MLCYVLYMNIPYTHIYVCQIFFVCSWLCYHGRKCTYCNTYYMTGKISVVTLIGVLYGCGVGVEACYLGIKTVHGTVTNIPNYQSGELKIWGECPFLGHCCQFGNLRFDHCLHLFQFKHTNLSTCCHIGE